MNIIRTLTESKIKLSLFTWVKSIFFKMWEIMLKSLYLFFPSEISLHLLTIIYENVCILTLIWSIDISMINQINISQFWQWNIDPSNENNLNQTFPDYQYNQIEYNLDNLQ